MLNADLLVQIFNLCDLETCVALSQVCSFNYTLFNKLDDLVSRKVLKRVPWFALNDSYATSWQKCALLLVYRTKLGLDSSQKHLYLLKNLNVAVSRGRNDTLVEPSVDLQNEEVRKTLTPLFDTQLGQKYLVQGSKLLTPGVALDLKTMVTETTDYDGVDTFDYSTCPNKAALSSGLVIRNAETDGYLRVMDENDHLVHVRFLSKEGMSDMLVHKKMLQHYLDCNGEVELKSYMDEPFEAPGINELDASVGTLVNLLPGSGGALVVETVEAPLMQMVYYMEPWTRTKYLICTVPPSLTYNTGYSDSKIRFYTTFNGYLYLYFSGRLFRLWVDIGYLSKFLDMKDMMLESELSCHAENRCLTVWDRKFPAIGTFPGGKGLEIVHGRGERMGRYVAVRGAFGRVVGDLVTGKTYYSSGKGIAIPIVKDDGNVGFCGVNTQASSYLIERVKETQGGNVGVDLSGDFEKCCSESQQDKIDISKIQDDPADASILNDERDLSEEYPWEIEGDEEREKERHGKLKREKENREREAKGRLEKAKAKEDNGDIQVLNVVDKDVIEISSGSDYGSDEEDEEELASDATDEEFGKYDNSDWIARRYREEEYARYRYYHDGPLSDEEEEEEEEEEVYDEWDVFDEEPEIYHNIFRELPSVELNPSWMNAPRAFVSVDDM